MRPSDWGGTEIVGKIYIFKYTFAFHQKTCIRLQNVCIPSQKYCVPRETLFTCRTIEIEFPLQADEQMQFLKSILQTFCKWNTKDFKSIYIFFSITMYILWAPMMTTKEMYKQKKSKIKIKNVKFILQKQNSIISSNNMVPLYHAFLTFRISLLVFHKIHTGLKWQVNSDTILISLRFYSTSPGS